MSSVKSCLFLVRALSWGYAWLGGFEPWKRGPGNQRRHVMQVLNSRYTGSEMIVGRLSHGLP